LRIPAEVEFIIDQLNRNNYEAYIVGGCVRDYILGFEPKDWDIATSATPDKIKKIFNHTVDTGIKHGTVTIILNHKHFEVTTYRIDGKYKDSRHPENVIFTKNIDEDLSRRDFTINAIAYNKSSGFIDTFKGVEDIERRIIRGVGNADNRFKEDALRMMRAVRFSAQLNFDIEKNTLNAIIKNAELLKNISMERIRDEFIKLLLSNYPQKINLLNETGLLNYFLPEIINTVKNNNECITNSLLISPKNVPIRLCILLSDYNSNEIINVLKRLKFDNKTINETSLLSKYLNYKLENDKYEIRKLLSILDKKIFENILILQKIKSEIILDYNYQNTLINIKISFKQIIDNGDCYNLKKLAINGEDIKLALKLKGKEIGNKLQQALEIVLREPKNNDKNYLIQELVKNAGTNNRRE